MEAKVKNKWRIILSASDINLINPTTEEIIDLITAAIPYTEISAQLTRLAAHVIKINIYGKSNKSWNNTVKDAIRQIQKLNTRHKAKGVYFDLKAMRKMLTEDWGAVLTWVAKESDSQWSTAALKKIVSLSEIWDQLTTLGVDKRI